jgi:hypothetical protein
MDNILDNDFIDRTNDNLPDGKFETYRMFTHLSIAQDFVTILDENKIPYKLEKGQDLLDGSIIGNSIRPQIALKLAGEDFSKVNQLLQQDIENKNGEYYEVLDDFSKEELFDILTNPDEWSPEAITTAKVRLQQQGEVVDDKYIKHLKDSRLDEIRKGKKPHFNWIVFYFALAILGGFFIQFVAVIPALGMGWYYWKGRSVDFEGKKYFTFEADTRNYGFLIFISAITATLIGFFYWTYFINS